MLQILETDAERKQFTADLKGKRVLHVKGFGGGFKDPTEEQKGIEAAQNETALLDLEKWAPDVIVVDGDPWGVGFQVHLKNYADKLKRDGQEVPKLVWAKDTKLEGDESRIADEAEREKKTKKAQEYADNGFSVVYYPVNAEDLGKSINKLYGDRFVEDNASAPHNARGLVKISSDPPPAWSKGMHDIVRESVSAIEHSDRGDKQYFEKCSFENSAKGNLIYDLLHNSESAAHGVACFGGGESVLLEVATRHLNSESGTLSKDVLVLPFSRGREGVDPKLPTHRGASFRADPKVDPAVTGATEMKVTTKKTVGFYSKCAVNFLRGMDAKAAEGEAEALEAKPAVENLRISGTGEAVGIAMQAAIKAQSEGAGTVTRIQTRQITMQETGRGCAQVLIDMKKA